MNLQDLNIGKSWTLFLDRDGVLNRRLPGDYVRHPGQLDIFPETPAAVAQLSRVFGRVCIVTNQRGIGRGLMTEADLQAVHAQLRAVLGAAGARIDGIYHCPHDIADRCGCRKPATGLAMQAQADFPEIDFRKSLLAGDSVSDLQLGRALEMVTVGICTEGQEEALKPYADYLFPGIGKFAEAISADRS